MAYHYIVTPLGYAVTVYKNGKFVRETIEATEFEANSVGLDFIERSRLPPLRRLSEPLPPE